MNVNEWQAVAERLNNTQVVVAFTKADGRVRRETGTLEYQPEEARVRVDKGTRGFRLIKLEYVVGIKQA